jgi:hypothetical protein
MIWSVKFSAPDLSAVAIASHDIEPGPEADIGADRENLFRRVNGGNDR